MKKIYFLVFFSISIMLINNPIYAVEISVPHAILIDMDSGKTLYEKDAYSPAYPASTTKILTAILTLENCNLDDVVTASYQAVNSVYDDGVTANIQSGETHTVRDLLSTLLVHSANDAAYVLAEHIGGSTESFATMMNARAKELGAQATYFVNPCGLPHPSHKCSVYDMSLFARYAMKTFPFFRETVSKVHYTLPITPEYEALYRQNYPDVSISPLRYLTTTTNHLINPDQSSYYYEYATGIKTGFTTEAGNCLVASAQKDDVDLLVVVFGENGWVNQRKDVVELLEYGFSKLTAEILAPAGSIIEKVKIKNGVTPLDVVVENTVKATFSSTDLIEAFTPTIEIDKNLKAPIQKGDVVGTITYQIYNTTYSSNLIAGNSIEVKPTIITEAVEATKDVFSVVLKIVIIVAIATIILFFAIVIIRAYIMTKKQRSRSHKTRMYNSRFR